MKYYRTSTFKVVQSRITLPIKSKLQAILATINARMHTNINIQTIIH
jgi:hypothetical protein